MDTCSGFGTGHAFRSTDAGLTCSDRSGNLPDIPVQCVAVNPHSPEWVYVGTDLGVFLSVDNGATWLDYNAGMPTAQVLDLVINPTQGKMRAATFGNGVYEIDLPVDVTGVADNLPGDGSGSGSGIPVPGGSKVIASLTAAPNPFRVSSVLRLELTQARTVSAEIYEAQGRRIRVLASGLYPAGISNLVWDGRDDGGLRVSAGAYFVRVVAGTEEKKTRVILVP